jgi:hypothetical protein
MSLDGRLNRIEAFFGTESGVITVVWCYCGETGPPTIDPDAWNSDVYRFSTPHRPAWMPAKGGMYLIREHEPVDQVEHDPEARAELVAEFLAILIPAQRRLAERARNLIVIGKAEPESKCEMTDEHYRDTTGFLPDDSQGD